MDYRRDYILRLIEEMAQFIGALIKQALGLTTLDEFRAVDARLDNAFKEKTGLSREGWLTLERPHDRERCVQAGMLFYAQAQLWEHWPDYKEEEDIDAIKAIALTLLAYGAGQDAEAARAIYPSVRMLDDACDELKPEDERILAVFYETAGE